MKIQSSIAYPFIIKLITRGGGLVGLVLVTLFLMLYYNAAYYSYTPLTGIRVDYIDTPPSALQVTQVLPGSPGDVAGLKPGDKLLTIDGQAIATLNQPIYTPKRAGEILRYAVERGGQKMTFDVTVGDYWQRPAYLLEMLPFGLLSLLVYALGLLLCLFSAPQDTRARLIGGVWLLAGLVLAVAGPGYANGGWFAFDVSLITYATGSYVSLAAHLYFPAAAFSSRVRIMILRIHLSLTLLTLAAYASQRMLTDGAFPPEAFVSGVVIKYIFILTWFVNIALLLKNRFTVRDEQARRQANIILIGTLLGLLPVLLFFSLPNLLLGPRFVILPGQITVFALVFIPLSYGYVIRQHKLLKIDLMVNRILAWFIVVVLALLTAAATVGLLSWLHGSLRTLLVGSVISTSLVILSLHKRIQVWVDRVLYGASYDFHGVTTHLSRRLAQISDRRDLDDVLTEFVQQMHIQKSKLLLAWGGQLDLSASQGEAFSVADDEICQFLLDSCFPERALSVWAVAGSETSERWAAYEWGRVFAPIAYNGTLHGVWVLGDRLIGAYYSEQDIENITTMSQMVALTAANIATVELLRGLTQRMVRVEEEHRRDMARELHDNVLQRISFFQNQPDLRPGWAVSLEEIADGVRQVIDIERTPLLEGEIALALEDLSNKLRSQVGDKTDIRLNNLLPESAGLDDETTTTIYRIVQEALSNALKHADAANVMVTLKMDGDVLVIEVEDDGIGMEDPGHEPSGHYGLLGMRERAAMIGATLSITSVVDMGTTVRVRLKP